MKDKEPKSEFARYAFGYSDKKPWGEIAILAAMVAFLVFAGFMGWLK